MRFLLLSVLCVFSCRTTEPNAVDSTLEAKDDGKTLKFELKALSGTHKVDVLDVPQSISFSYPSTSPTPNYADDDGFGGISCARKGSVGQTKISFDVKVKSGVLSAHGLCSKFLGDRSNREGYANLLMEHNAAHQKIFGNLINHNAPHVFYLQRPEVLIAEMELKNVKLIAGDCTTKKSGSSHTAFTFGKDSECVFEYESRAARDVGRTNQIILKKIGKLLK